MQHYQLFAPADRIAFSATDGQRTLYIKSAQGLIQASIPIPKKPTLWIIRGLPGSGKTTLAREIAAELGILHLEPDMLLTHGGQYDYTEERYESAVRRIFHIMGALTGSQCDFVFADVIPCFYGILQQDGYEIIVITMPKLTLEESIERNTHNVRREDIEKMMADWEDYS